MKNTLFKQLYIPVLLALVIIFASFSIITSVIVCKHLDYHAYKLVYSRLAVSYLLILLSSLFGLSYLIHVAIKRLLTPLDHLKNSIIGILDGDYEVKEIIHNSDEIGLVIEKFMQMSSKIERNYQKAFRQKEALVTIINSIPQPLWVINEAGKLVLTNQSFKNMVSYFLPEGKYFWEVILNPELQQLVKTCNTGKVNLLDEIEYNGRYYLCTANFIISSREFVFILQDISKMKELEKIKKDFVINVSHELRTPLTAIKGFAETMEADCAKDQVHYLEVINRNTDRLINIVNDLLSLSGLEDSKSLKVTQIDFNILLSNVIKLFEDKARKKNLSFEIQNNFPENNLMADEFKLEQMFINLMDNAMKYSEKGVIYIRLIKEITNLRLEIEDSGLGISQEHIPRLFERFYVIDSSRARKTGGTGLGLSIVKHIVLMHNGNIEVSSEENVGTKFTIWLPLNQSIRDV